MLKTHKQTNVSKISTTLLTADRLEFAYSIQCSSETKVLSWNTLKI